MNRKPVILTVACSFLFLSGCAAKNRWFSRKDYSEMQDPFMESEAIADKDAGKPGGKDSDTAGRARLGSSDSSVASTTEPSVGSGTSTARNVMQTSASEEGVARTGQVSAASYPEKSAARPGMAPSGSAAARSWSGPALSDFLSGKQAEGSATASSSGDATAKTAQLPKPGVSPSGTKTASPAARAASLPNIEAETESFSSFLQQKSATVDNSARQLSDAVSTKSQQVNGTVKATEQSAGDFADWAAQEQQKWNEQGQNAASTVSAVPGAVRQQVNSAAKQTRKVMDDAVLDFNTVSEEEFADEPQAAAQPLMKKYSQPAPSATVTKPAPKSGNSPQFDEDTTEENPFANPFETDDFEPAPVRKPSASKASSSKNSTPSSGSSNSSTRKARRTLDDGFQMDSGWKPSHFEHP